MSGGPPNKDGHAGQAPRPHDDGKRSGEGADTALEALTRERRAAGRPDPPEPAPPAPSQG